LDHPKKGLAAQLGRNQKQAAAQIAPPLSFLRTAWRRFAISTI
jgi:hypothetical protein